MDGYEPYDGGASPSYFRTMRITGTILSGNILTNFNQGRILQLTQTSGGLFTFVVVTQNNSTFSTGPNTNHIDVNAYVIPYAFPSGVLTASAPFAGFGNYAFVHPINTALTLNSATIAASLTASINLSLSDQQAFYLATASVVQPVPG